MEEDKKLYPLRFAPLTDQYVWGSEVFKICDLVQERYWQYW